MDITGAELIIRFFETRTRGHGGAGPVAVMPGGASLWPLERALAASSLPRAQEHAARVVLADLSNGSAHLAGLLMSAKVQRRAMLIVAVQVRRSLIGTEACQPVQTRRVLDASTKSWFHVGAAMELLELLPQALWLASSGRRGPVLLEIPQDVLTEQIQGAWIPQPRLPARIAAFPIPQMLHA
jgi:acetolactate synthase-1/2/3 large subunit